MKTSELKVAFKAFVVDIDWLSACLQEGDPEKIKHARNDMMKTGRQVAEMLGELEDTDDRQR
jgi:hypothetical protein